MEELSIDTPEWVKKHRGGEPLTADDFADAVESIMDELDTLIEQVESEAHVGAFDDIDNITVPDPEKPASEEYRKKHGESATEEDEFRKKWKWDAGEQVILKGKYLAADHEAVQNANSPAAKTGEGKKQDVEARMGSGHIKILERMIVGWTFTRRGHAVELTPQNIRRLPSNYLTPLLEKCDEISVGMSEEQQDDFLPASSEPTKENLPTKK